MKILYNIRVERRKLVIGALFFACLLVAGLLVLIKRIKIKDEKGLMEEIIIRSPAVAGQFYPQGEEDLRAMADEFLSAAKQKTKKASYSSQILVVPHAGWEYSGQTAAFGFTQIENSDFRKVILIGPSHQAFFEGVAIDDSDYWQTPLGKVAIDKTLVNKILSPQEGIIANREAHENEHCLEVELPFLQTVLSDFKIVPVLIGQASEGILELLAQEISDEMREDEQVLLIISSDLSHYPNIETARVVDQQTVEAILSGSKDKFVEVLKKLTDEYPQVDTFACGHEAIKVGLMAVQNLGITENRLLALTNSGEITNQRERVVGYAAIGFYGKSKVEGELDRSQQEELLKVARKTLENYLRDGEVLNIKIDDEVLNQKRGVFVTLKKDDQLRGCIGQFVPQKPLCQLIQDMAISAAMHDSRFPPVEYGELEDIKIEISVLSLIEKINSPEEIELGKHGVYLKYGQRTATFLPQVAAEAGWTKEEFLSQLCTQKAGLPADCYLDPDVELFVYTAQVFGE